MIPIKWILFDLGGIFLPETRDHVLSSVADSLGIDSAEFIQAVDRYFDQATAGKLTLLELYAEVVKDLSIDADPADVLSCHLDLYREFSESPEKDMIALVEQLKKNFSVACLTNTEPEIAEISRETGLLDPFQRAYLSVELGMIKPDPEIFRAVITDISCSPEEIVFVDDREENAEAARQTGMHAIHFRSVSQLKEDLSLFTP